MVLVANLPQYHIGQVRHYFSTPFVAAGKSLLVEIEVQIDYPNNAGL